MAVVVQVGSRVGSRVGTHTIPWPQRVHSGSPCKPLSGAPSLLAAGLRFLGPPDPGRSPEIQSAGDMNGVGETKNPISAGCYFWALVRSLEGKHLVDMR